jgi:membrane fusion protein, multidrug efflux system
MDNPQDPRWLRLTGRVLGLAIIVSSLATAFYVTRLLYHRPRTDDAVVRANLVGIAPHVSGPIIELDVADNQEVQEGDLLFVIDPRPFKVDLERAQANLLLTESEVQATSNAVAAAKSNVEQLEVEDAFEADHVKRLASLVQGKFVTQDEFQAAQVKASATRAALAQARQELARQQNLLGQYGDLNAHLKAAEAAVDAAKLNLTYCRVRAPFRGRVTNLNISKGEYAQAGKQVFALVDTRVWYVIANFQETYLEYIKTGMTADVFLLSYPGHRFRGTVEGIGWAVLSPDEQTVGVLPNVTPTLNWVRLAQRIPVRIRLEAPDPNRPYRMGMTAVVTLHGGLEAASASEQKSPP